MSTAASSFRLASIASALRSAASHELLTVSCRGAP
jgi:hypothetical protein